MICLEYMSLDLTAPDLLLPAVILGFSGPVPHDAPAWPWLVSSAHQYGGYACSHEHIFGLLLPLEVARQSQSIVDSLRVLQCDDRRDPSIRARPDLATLHLTCGASYSRGQLDVLEALFANGPPLPRIRRGAEASLEFEACDLFSYFADWWAIARELPVGTHPSDPVAIAGAGTDVSLRGARVDAWLLGALRKLREDPRAFLVWRNSD